MQLQPLIDADLPALFDFEQRNWDYFSQHVPARPDSYREYASFCQTQRELLAERDTGATALFVAYENDTLIARGNLVDITKSTADIGYRVCQSWTGKGLATKIVTQLIEIAIKRGLSELTATVSHTNPASEKVLTKTGFEYLRTEIDAFELNGQSVNFRYFRKTLTKPLEAK